MKMSKRIFIVLLTVALLVSAFAFSASAAEVTVENYENVLDYYEHPTIFSLDFAGEDVDYADDLMIQTPANVTSALVEDSAAPGGKYLGLAFKVGRPPNKGNLYFNWNADDSISDFYLDMTVSGNAGAGSPSNAPKLTFIIGESNFNSVANGSTDDTAILVLDFATGGVKYSMIDSDGDLVSVEEPGVLTKGAWYNVSVTYSVEAAVCVIDVKNVNDESNSFTVATNYIPYDAIGNVRVGVHNSNGTAGNVINVAALNAAGGTVRRNLANPQSAIENTVLGMYDLYCSNIDKSEKVNICSVINKLLGYGFTSELDEVNAAIDALKFGSVTLYSDEIDRFLVGYAKLANYDEKRALVDANMEYADVLKNIDLSPVGDEKAAAIRANLDTFYGIDEALKRAEADSIAFIEVLQGVEEVLDSTDYSVLNSFFEPASAYTPDLTYAGVAEVYGNYLILEENVLDIANSAEKFIDLVNAANNAEIPFMERYNVYITIEDNFFRNETYPGVTEAIALYNDVLAPYMDAEIALAENFITYVSRAQYSTYISAKQANLDIAKQYMDVCEPQFEGVAEAKVLYAEIVEYIAEQIKLANAYIDAVNAIDGKTGAELTAAIANAKALQAAGNVLGVDGVTEANIKLDEISTQIELADKYCTYFIHVVDSIEKAESTKERYNLLVEAKYAEKDADPAYPGVSDASKKLASAIEAYNNEVNKVNSAYETATEVAINTCTVGKTANSVSGHVVALVKKLFDEE